MTAAPDFFEPLIGFRGWHVDAEGWLRPWAFPGEPWRPGVNQARCQTHAGHRPPVADCMCGLYGLTRPGDHRLDAEGDQAVGAIAAWGDVEVHRTGFRAQSACVTALAAPPAEADPQQRRCLARAADRYDVPIVPRGDLWAEAQRHGAPLPGSAWSRSVGAPATVPPLQAAHLYGYDAGIAASDHVWVGVHGGVLRLGITPAFARRLGALDGSFPLPPAGRTVARGDVLTVLGSPSASYYVSSPFAGTVGLANPALRARPEALLRDPAGRGWLLELRPTAWTTDAAGVTWGAGRDRAYALALSAERGDPFAGLHVERLRAMPPVSSWAGIAAALRRERITGWFASAEEVHERLGRGLLDALTAEPDRRRALDRLAMDVAFRIADPDTTLRIRARDGGAALLWGAPAVGPADLELSLTADAAHDYFTGALDPALALRTGAICSSLPRDRTLRALSVLKVLRLPRLPRLATWERTAALAPSLRDETHQGRRRAPRG